MGWKDRLDKLTFSTFVDPEASFVENTKASNIEAGIVNRNIDFDGVNPAVICRKDGCIEIFVTQDLGIRLDPKAESITFMCIAELYLICVVLK